MNDEDTVQMSPEAAKHYYQHKTARWEVVTDTIKWIVVSAAVLALLIGIGFLIAHNIDSDRQVRLACINSGKQWVTGTCVGGQR